MVPIKLVLFLGFDPAELVKVQLPENFEVVGCSFLELESVKGILQNVNWILINLSDLSKTDPLNDTALEKWREVFADLVQKSVATDGNYAQLVGVADSPDWRLAELGVAVGARELVLLNQLANRLGSGSERFFNTDPKPENLIPFRDPRNQMKPLTPATKKIPLNQIPVPIRGLEGQSKAIENLRNLIRKCAPTQSTLLISGETGVGKEQVARSIHNNSQNARKNFRIFHASEITEANFGDFFDFRKHPTGTLVIDHIEDLNATVQSRLSAFLMQISQENYEGPRPRLLVTTQVDLKKHVESGKFREDLYFRINVIEIAIPALRFRRGDLEDLSDALLARIARRNHQKRLPLAAGTFEKLLHYEWPGNIRELENVLEHASLSSWSKDGSEIQPDDLPDHIRSAEMNAGQKDTLKEAVRRFEREHIAKTLSRFGGSKESAAEALGLSLASLYRKLGNG